MHFVCYVCFGSMFFFLVWVCVCFFCTIAFFFFLAIAITNASAAVAAPDLDAALDHPHNCIFPLVYRYRLAKTEDTKVEKALLTFINNNNNKSNFISYCLFACRKYRFDSATALRVWVCERKSGRVDIDASVVLRSSMWFSFFREKPSHTRVLFPVTMAIWVYGLYAGWVQFANTQKYSNDSFSLGKNTRAKRPIYN